MPIHLLLNRTQSEKEVSIPIATEESFEKDWLPIARKNSLEYITDIYGGGYDINQANLIEMIKEFEIISKLFQQQMNYSSEDKDFFSRRLNQIINTLKEEVSYEEVQGWVG